MASSYTAPVAPKPSASITTTTIVTGENIRHSTTPLTTPSANGGVNNPITYPIKSLYISDLHPDVSETQLFEKFSNAGPVRSIHVCRDAVTGRSLGYAYVNFQNQTDAQRALVTMNFDLMNRKPIRISWSQHDHSINQSGVFPQYLFNFFKHQIDVNHQIAKNQNEVIYNLFKNN